MKKINYILTVLLVGGSVSLNAQRPEIAAETQLPDTLSIGYQMNTSARTSSYSINGVNARSFEKSPYRYKQSVIRQNRRTECTSG